MNLTKNTLKLIKHFRRTSKKLLSSYTFPLPSSLCLAKTVAHKLETSSTCLHTKFQILIIHQLPILKPKLKQWVHAVYFFVEKRSRRCVITHHFGSSFSVIRYVLRICIFVSTFTYITGMLPPLRTFCSKFGTGWSVWYYFKLGICGRKWSDNMAPISASTQNYK